MMSMQEKVATENPSFSVVIAAYNDWIPLHDALQSLSQQRSAPSFEVIIIDDGSWESAPDTIREFDHFYPLTIVRQEHAGIAAARNNGVRHATGTVLLFTDADCNLQPDCLAHLRATIANSPDYSSFQLHIVGNCSRLAGRAEHLRLTALQDQLLEPDGRIRYLNTAGFAIRYCRMVQKDIFDSRASRAEDTMLLADLLANGELPYFVREAIVEHAIPLSVLQCFRKDIRTAFTEAPTYKLIAAKGMKVRMSHRGRLGVLLSMWKTSGYPSIGRVAWVIVVLRQAVQRLVSAICLLLPSKQEMSG